MYVKVTNGEIEQFPYSVSQLRKDNPNTSFAKKISDAVLAGYGVYPVVNADAPSYDSATQKLVRASEPVLVDNVWTITASVADLTQDEIDSINANLAENIREKRDELLARTDYLALSDNTLSAEMATYRQALRDITAQDGFPTDINWPVRPE